MKAVAGITNAAITNVITNKMRKNLFDSNDVIPLLPCMR